MELISSNSDLTQWMAWAQQKAASFVMTGQSGPVNRGDGGKWYGPSGRFSNRSRGAMDNKKTNYQLKCGHIKPLRNGC